MSALDVLVTGSSGHLGHALMLELPRYGYQPIGIDILPSSHTALVGSISDRTFIASLFSTHPSIRYVLHTATLHKPHVGSHTKGDFIDTNITGTLVLLEESSKTGTIESFIFTSTTSTFGSALSPRPGKPAVWITESTTPIPKNIYGATKVAAEDFCHLIHLETKMPILVLKTSRFFPEQDDDAHARELFEDDRNLKILELMFRRVDLEDVVSAHVYALRKAASIKWGKYIISAPSPFSNDSATMAGLDSDAASVIQSTTPEVAGDVLAMGWRLPQRIDRVYDSGKAVRELGWSPKWTFEVAMRSMREGLRWRSELTERVGKRGYHQVPTGVYTV